MNTSNENLTSYSELHDSKINIMKNLLSDECNLGLGNNNLNDTNIKFSSCFFDNVGGPEMPIVNNNIEKF